MKLWRLLEGKKVPFPKNELRASVLVSERLGVCYVSTPLAGSSSVKLAMVHAHTGDLSILGDQVHRTAVRVLDDPRRDIDKYLYSDHFFRFAVVRDPSGRALSGYAKKEKNPVFRMAMLKVLGESEDRRLTLDEFLDTIERTPDAERDRHWRSQFALLRPDVVSYDRIVRLDRIAEEWPAIARRLRLENPVLPLVNPRPRKRKSFKLTEEQKRRVEKIYAQDMETFFSSVDA